MTLNVDILISIIASSHIFNTAPITSKISSKEIGAPTPVFDAMVFNRADVFSSAGSNTCALKLPAPIMPIVAFDGFREI
ncbi:MAG: hypothetical protein OMM_12255 [Candidatus Magnetoglobus multicellularis str. Araruama]|uniref:Uncharacterized protein n=1 Tax=Candidatus Magnetoglobus multicellularis str. Araruama TaxID=890399 RepID=A0A1V1NW85_9BACT|nr:MAG: hypothetical protein OMM_12255 [Candidatus Magnetoglobus multicellularis str. Araruama]